MPRRLHQPATKPSQPAGLRRPVPRCSIPLPFRSHPCARSQVLDLSADDSSVDAHVCKSDVESETMIGREDATLVFKAASEPTRLRMLRLLVANKAEMCVCEFVDALGERQYNVSRQLKILQTAGLIRGEKEGRWIYYRLSAKKDPAVAALYRLVARLPEDELFAADQRRFRERMSLRSASRCRVGIQTPSLTS